MNFMQCDYIFGNSIRVSIQCFDTGPCQNGVVNDLELIELFYQKVTSLNKNSFLFLDIGANTGSFCLLPALDERFFCYAFEPNLIIFHILKDNIELNGISHRVKPFPLGVWEENKELTLKIPCEKRYSGISTLADFPNRFELSDIKSFSTQKVLCFSLDFFLGNNITQKIDAIKIDSEGSELSILKGAKEIIKKHHPIILTEYDNKNTSQFGYGREEIKKYLVELGYNFFEQYKEGDLFAW